MVNFLFLLVLLFINADLFSAPDGSSDDEWTHVAVDTVDDVIKIAQLQDRQLIHRASSAGSESIEVLFTRGWKGTERICYRYDRTSNKVTKEDKVFDWLPQQ